jgi:hypothetical protein
VSKAILREIAMRYKHCMKARAAQLGRPVARDRLGRPAARSGLALSDCAVGAPRGHRRLAHGIVPEFCWAVQWALTRA